MSLVGSVQPVEWQGNPIKNYKFTRINNQMINTLQFLEQLPFSSEVPYTVRWKSFPENEIVPLHYAPTIEIILTENVIGSITVGQNDYSFRQRDLIYIPPWIVHSTKIKQCEGILYGIKISLEDISKFVGINKLLKLKDLTVFDIATVHDDFNQAYEIMNLLIKDDADCLKRYIHILELLDLLSKNTICRTEKTVEFNRFQDNPLHKLIIWTGEHYMEKITIDDAANVIHLSKSYFCKYFKQQSRITYLTYLNQVRIAQAAIKLREGLSVADSSHICGFTNTSYFIRLFRSAFGCTPGDYIRRL